MAVTAASLAAALALKTDDGEPDTAEATRLLAIASALVSKYLRGNAAPVEIADEAIIRTAGHLERRRGYGVTEGPMTVGGLKVVTAPVASNPVRQSGAGALLAPYVRRTA